MARYLRITELQTKSFRLIWMSVYLRARLSDNLKKNGS